MSDCLAPGARNIHYQHRTFIRLASYMGLTTQERSLYEMLLEIDNSSGWKEWILLTNPDLQKQAHISNYGSFATARARLVKKGFIHFISGGTGKPCSYSLVKLYDPVPDYLQGYLEKAIQREKEDRIKMQYAECCYGESIKASIEAYNSGAELEDGSDNTPEAMPDAAVEENYQEEATEANCQAAESEHNEIVADIHDKNEVNHHNKNEIRSTTKTAHIHKHNKRLEKDINDGGSQQESLSQADCHSERTIDPVAMERHAKWFTFYARGKRLSHNEQKIWITSSCTSAPRPSRRL